MHSGQCTIVERGYQTYNCELSIVNCAIWLFFLYQVSFSGVNTADEHS